MRSLRIILILLLILAGFSLPVRGIVGPISGDCPALPGEVGNCYNGDWEAGMDIPPLYCGLPENRSKTDENHKCSPGLFCQQVEAGNVIKGKCVEICRLSSLHWENAQGNTLTTARGGQQVYLTIEGSRTCKNVPLEIVGNRFEGNVVPDEEVVNLLEVNFFFQEETATGYKFRYPWIMPAYRAGRLNTYRFGVYGRNHYNTLIRTDLDPPAYLSTALEVLGFDGKSSCPAPAGGMGQCYTGLQFSPVLYCGLSEDSSQTNENYRCAGGYFCQDGACVETCKIRRVSWEDNARRILTTSEENKPVNLVVEGTPTCRNVPLKLSAARYEGGIGAEEDPLLGVEFSFAEETANGYVYQYPWQTPAFREGVENSYRLSVLGMNLYFNIIRESGGLFYQSGDLRITERLPCALGNLRWLDEEGDVISDPLKWGTRAYASLEAGEACRGRVVTTKIFQLKGSRPTRENTNIGEVQSRIHKVLFHPSRFAGEDTDYFFEVEIEGEEYSSRGKPNGKISYYEPTGTSSAPPSLTTTEPLPPPAAAPSKALEETQDIKTQLLKEMEARSGKAPDVATKVIIGGLIALVAGIVIGGGIYWLGNRKKGK